MQTEDGSLGEIRETVRIHLLRGQGSKQTFCFDCQQVIDSKSEEQIQADLI
jgi:hypothetical protein